MPSWFQLPAEIRIRVYEYVFDELVLKPLQQPNSATHKDKAIQTPSPAFALLAVSRQWNREITPYLLQAATFDFTAHAGDPPHMVSLEAYEVMRHVVILETHCFSTDWRCQVLDRMTQVQTMTMRKLRRVGAETSGAFDGPGLTQKFIEKVKIDPVKTLLNGYRLDHAHIKDTLKRRWPKRRVLLEGRLWLPDCVETAHSKFLVDLDTWKVQIEGLLEGAKSCEIQASEPAPVKAARFEDEEGMFEYLIRQHLASL